ncbi:uncharacterized protein [Henckelia pumila]|uniref:uncharacterized protein n=1 Tax=Henckelia pumila TaxID=405737 RepID=UPI003C6DE3C8
MIADSPQEKLRQFVEGLKAEIRHDVRMADVFTYESAVSRALRSEEGRRAIQREQQGKRQFVQTGYQRPSSQPPAKKQYTGPAKGPNQQQRPQQQRPQQQQRGGAPNAIAHPICPKCQKMHSGPCLLGAGVCFHCREPGHQIANCPRKKNTAGRVFVMQAEEVDPDTSLITGRILVGGNSTFALLDSGATHSFISLEFIRRVGITPESSDSGYDVTMPSGQIMSTSKP